jgi:hypothetical protein
VRPRLRLPRLLPLGLVTLDGGMFLPRATRLQFGEKHWVFERRLCSMGSMRGTRQTC